MYVELVSDEFADQLTYGKMYLVEAFRNNSVLITTDKGVRRWHGISNFRL